MKLNFYDNTNTESGQTTENNDQDGTEILYNNQQQRKQNNPQNIQSAMSQDVIKLKYNNNNY